MIWWLISFNPITHGGGVFSTQNQIHFDRSVDPLMTIYPPRDFLTFPKYVLGPLLTDKKNSKFFFLMTIFLPRVFLTFPKYV